MSRVCPAVLSSRPRQPIACRVRCRLCGSLLGTALAGCAVSAAAGTAPITGAPPATARADQPRIATTSCIAAGASAPCTAPQSLAPVTVHALYYGRGNGYLAPYGRTATGTLAPLLNVPLSIQAIPSRLLRDQGARSLEDAMRNAPGVSVHQGEGNRDEVLIRGVKTKSDFFVNGLRDDTEYFRDLYNVREVDVLQGPSALLFGRGNAGGVINLVTHKAERRRIRQVTLGTGSWHRKRATLDLGGPLGTDAAWRLDAVDEVSGGFRDYFSLHRRGINPMFSFRIGDATRVDVGIEHFHETRRADRGIPSRGHRPAEVPRARFFGSPDQNVARADVDSFHLRLQHDLNADWQFRNTVRINRNRKFYRNMYPGSAVAADDTFTMSGYEHGNTRTSYLEQAEAVADLDAGRVQHELLLGFDASWQVGDDWANKAEPIPGVSLAQPLVNGQYVHAARVNHALGREFGLYAEDRMRLGDQWLVLAGIRRDRFAIGAHYHLLPDNATTRHVDTSWSPRLGVIYKPAENDSIYASATRSFTPQGANIALSTKSPVGQNLGPQHAVNYEIGNKLDFADGKLSFTAALFQLTLDDLTSKDPLDPTRLVQTGTQRSRGLELALTGQLSDRWRVAANYSRMRSKIVDATKKAPAGARVGLVPDQQFSLWSTFALNDHWGVGGGVSGRSRVYTSFRNVVVLPGYATAQAMAYFRTGGLRVQLNVDNLFDRHYFPTANGDNQIMPGAPRNVQLDVRLGW